MTKLSRVVVSQKSIQNVNFKAISWKILFLYMKKGHTLWFLRICIGIPAKCVQLRLKSNSEICQKALCLDLRTAVRTTVFQIQKITLNLNIFSIENGILPSSSMTQVQNKILSLIMSCPACLGNFLLWRYPHFQTKSGDVGGTLDPSNL